MKRLMLTTVLCVAALMVGAAPPAGARGSTVLDGVRVGHLPNGLGTSSDFTYEYDEVAFVSRVWESQTTEGWQVDLSVDVLRSPRLTDGQTLHDWIIDYEDRPAGEADYVPTSVHHRPAWVNHDEIFWLLRPGLAMSVRLDTARWPHAELATIARSVELVRRQLAPGSLAEATTRSISQ